MAKRIRRSLSFSSKGKEIIERTKDIIDEQDPYKLLEKGFEQIKKKRLYNEGWKSKLNNSLYIYTNETKLSIVNKQEELTLINWAGRDYLENKII